MMIFEDVMKELFKDKRVERDDLMRVIFDRVNSLLESREAEIELYFDFIVHNELESTFNSWISNRRQGTK